MSLTMKIDEMIAAAREERWEAIDSAIPRVCNRPDYTRWAYETGLNDTDDNVRDLAASILEKARFGSEFKRMRPKLFRLMRSDPHKYARYRCAFALAAHRVHTAAVKNVLTEATQDKAVADIAQRYLSQF